MFNPVGGSLRFCPLALACLLPALGACWWSDDDASTVPSGPLTYHYFQSDDPKTLDPAVAYDQISWDILGATLETLYQYAYLASPYRIEPLLAADLPKLSKDRLTLTIPLRSDVRFQSDPAFKTNGGPNGGQGRPLTAYDFIYAWKRLALPALQSPGLWVFEGKIRGFDAFRKRLLEAPKEKLAQVFSEPVEGFRAIDDHTIEIRLTRPYPQLLYVLTMPFTAPLARETVEAYGDANGALQDRVVGTGPFILAEWRRGHRVRLDRNPDYHPDFYPREASPEFERQGYLADAGRTLPLIDRIELETMKEEQPAWLNFLKGRIDRMSIPKDSFAAAITDRIHLSDELAGKGMQLITTDEATFYYVGFNMKDAVVGGKSPKAKLLRQALSSAIDRERFIEIFLNGRGKKMTAVLPEGIPGRPEKPALRFDYDRARAKDLLKKAGYADGRGLPTLTLDLRGAGSVERQMGEFFERQFDAIGVRLRVIYNARPAFLEKEKQGNLQLFLGSWIMDYPDAENAFQLLHGPNRAPGPNSSNFDNAEFNDLYERMATLMPGPERDRLLARMDEIVQEHSPWAFLYTRVAYRLVHGWLKNYRPSDMILNKYKYFRIDPKQKKELLKKL